MTATPTPLQDLSAGFTALVAEAASSVVAVHSRRSRSSGFLWRPGLVVTADEALADEGDVTVALPGGTRPAELSDAIRRPTSPCCGSALPSSPAPMERLALAPGAMALVVGAEDGDPTAALGMVSRTGGSWGACGAAKSMRGSNSASACGERPKAGLPSIPSAGGSAWRCSDPGSACW